MKCPRCSSVNIAVVKDSRGLPEAHCADCDAYIKKMSTGEVITYFEHKIEELQANKPQEIIKEVVVEHKPEEKEKCRYCTEYYFTRHGRMGTVYYPIEAIYCPMCGRKLLPEDRNY